MEPSENITIHTGFPNPATDTTILPLDLNKLIIKHPPSTFFMRVSGHTWEKFGIFDEDIAIIDRSLKPRNKDLVVFWNESDFYIKRFSKLPLDTLVWGVIISIVHRYRL